MRTLLVSIYLLTISFEAMACGLQGATSMQNLLQVAAQAEAPASAHLPKTLINGGSTLIVKNDKGEDVKIDANLVLARGMTITTNASKAKVNIPATGQSIELLPMTTIKVLQYNKSAEQKICHLSFELQRGRAVFSSEHQAREKDCKPIQQGVFEVATKAIEITPIGTKYSVDLNQAIAELNGETVEIDENVSVQKGAVQIRIVRMKKSNAKKVTSKKLKLASSDDSAEEKPIVVKAGRKARVKKSKTDRMADIQIVYPEQ
ncbi:MAG: FecR domain-containing protein [Bdellovibrionota bacterium]